MIGFYVWQRLGQVPERVIWSERYFDASWQAFFDVFNSLPLIAAAALVAAWRRSEWMLALLLSMAVHAVCDLLVHREDAHGHFYPLTSWRFISPVSYWDPAHYGAWFLGFELLLVLTGSVLLLRRQETPWRVVGASTLALTAAFALFAVVTWSGASLEAPAR